jgi:myosin heavy chain 9/10/11/14
MSAPAQHGPKWRNSPFGRASQPSSPAMADGKPRPVSAILSSTSSSPLISGHARTHSFSPLTGLQQAPTRANSTRKRSNSYRSGTPATGTFAPTFIKSEEMQQPMPNVDGIEGENDFSGKRYVWLKDPTTAFIKGWVVEELEHGKLRIQCDDGSVRTHIRSV